MLYSNICNTIIMNTHSLNIYIYILVERSLTAAYFENSVHIPVSTHCLLTCYYSDQLCFSVMICMS